MLPVFRYFVPLFLINPELNPSLHSLDINNQYFVCHTKLSWLHDTAVMAATPHMHAHHCVRIDSSDGLKLLEPFGDNTEEELDGPVQAFDSSVTDDTERICAFEQSLIDPQYDT